MIPKFRAWYKTDEEMVHWKQMKSEFTFGYFEDENLDFMQSTGLFDKNGVEIFEGDVVETTWFKDHYDYSGYRKVGEVVFRDGYFGIKYPDDSERYPYQIAFVAIDKEIIGNVYENPGLVQ